MSTFICQGKYSPEDWQSTISHGHWTGQMEGLAQEMGGKLLGYYVTFGPTDFLVILDAPDAMTATVLASAIAGTIGVTATLAMLPHEAAATFSQADGAVDRLLMTA